MLPSNEIPPQPATQKESHQPTVTSHTFISISKLRTHMPHRTTWRHRDNAWRHACTFTFRHARIILDEYLNFACAIHETRIRAHSHVLCFRCLSAFDQCSTPRSESMHACDISRDIFHSTVHHPFMQPPNVRSIWLPSWSGSGTTSSTQN